MKLIDRVLYIDRLKRVKGTPDIKIITGTRRGGCSVGCRGVVVAADLQSAAVEYEDL